jgi:cyclophilin family peptidyl-prolyl cis-trans isomerase
MWLMVALLLAQSSLERTLLEVEDRRDEDASALVEALKNPDPRIQRIAARGLGRMERLRYAGDLLPLLERKDPALRSEAVNALGQMGADLDLGPYLERETDGAVRGVIYETMGRLPGADERVLRRGLGDPDVEARTGAAKGLESHFRTTKSQPESDTMVALRGSLRAENPSTLLQLALLTLNAAGDVDGVARAAMLDHPDPLVRRLAVIGPKTFREDASPIVRYASLRVAATCERATGALDDPSEHVVLLAIDKLGDLGCASEALGRLVSDEKGWRRPSRALVALAKVDHASARRHLPRFVEHPVWQARAYAARAARVLKEEQALARLVRDPHPNVVAAALVDPSDAVRALASPDYGLLVDATRILEGWSEGASAVPALLDALDRTTAEGRATSRDPRRGMLLRLQEFGDERIVDRLRPLLADFDPVIAELAAEVMMAKDAAPVSAETKGLTMAAPPPQVYIDGLIGARARIRMKEAGTFVMELLPEEAPVTVAVFAELAEESYYDGLTFHRIAPNFVLQGGSPGANEYVGTRGYIRDELGLLSHLRGTLGISTRGRDTGDSQIFINLVDNYRLDHDYTVCARVIEGMDNVDRIQEGDVMQSVRIERRIPEPLPTRGRGIGSATPAG